MADITLTCEHCGKNLTVSEFVDRGALVCPVCGRKPQSEASGSASSQQPAASRLKMREVPPPPPPTAAENAAALAMQQHIQHERKRLAMRDYLPLAYWLIPVGLLLLLAIILGSRAQALARWALGTG